MTNYFLTIKKSGTSLYKEKGSKFLGFSYSVYSVDDILKRLENLRKQYHDAKHHCYAYILGKEGKEFKSHDGGEPNHSAGDPILRQIKSANLTNTLVVVIRYFGGTKLGIGGLVNAYKNAAEEALLNSSKIKKNITALITISYPYSSTNKVVELMHRYNLKIIRQDFKERCYLTASIAVSKHVMFKKDFQILKDLGHDIKS